MFVMVKENLPPCSFNICELFIIIIDHACSSNIYSLKEICCQEKYYIKGMYCNKRIKRRINFE